MALEQAGINNLTDVPQIIANEALRRLKNNLVLSRLVNQSYTKEFASVGETINIDIPVRVKAEAGRVANNTQPLIQKTTPLTINKDYHVMLQVESRDLTLNIRNFEEKKLEPAVRALANKLDTSIAEAMREGFFNAYITNSGAAVNKSDFFKVGAYMTKMAVPNDGNRRFVMNPLDSADMADSLTTMYNEKINSKALRESMIGVINKFKTFESQNLLNHTVANHSGTPLINGANQTGSSLVTDGWAASTTILKKGDVITIDGVYEVNPENYENTGRLQRFVVTADVTSDGSGNATIPISPSINDGSLTTTDSEGNTISLAAYQNVSAAPADNAAITVIGDAGATYMMNYAFHKDAVVLAVPRLKIPEMFAYKAIAMDKQTGLAIAVMGGSDVSKRVGYWRLDLIWGVKAVYPELGYKIFSQKV